MKNDYSGDNLILLSIKSNLDSQKKTVSCSGIQFAQMYLIPNICERTSLK